MYIISILCGLKQSIVLHWALLMTPVEPLIKYKYLSLAADSQEFAKLMKEPQA